MSIGKIIQQLKKNRPIDKKEEAFIEKAYEFAKQAHKGQLRKTGEPYILHPLRAAYLLATIGADYQTVAAGLLHDVIEDTPTTKLQIARRFCKSVADLVDGVTKVKRVKYDDTDYQKASLNKTLKAISGDMRVAVVRLADRFDNMQSLQVHPKEKKERIANETLDIFSPIAERLGIGLLKGDLEDLSFYYLYPEKFKKLKADADKMMLEKKENLKKFKTKLMAVFRKEKVKVDEINLRNKHYYSLYRKMERYEESIEQIQDLVVVRVIVPSVNNCYQALRAIHKHFKFLPGRIKDYIALPKANGYQAIHTVVFDKLGGITEVQIKTQEMHDRSKLGVVMDLDTVSNGTDSCKNNTQWLKYLKEWQSEADNLPPNDFYDILKSDFLRDRIVVFDQRGNVYDLPEGSTIIDFSFVTQGLRGLHTYKGKVNNETRVLCHRLKNGDIIEVGLNKNIKLKKNLIKCAKTNIARRYLSS